MAFRLTPALSIESFDQKRRRQNTNFFSVRNPKNYSKLRKKEVRKQRKEGEAEE